LTTGLAAGALAAVVALVLSRSRRGHRAVLAGVAAALVGLQLAEQLGTRAWLAAALLLVGGAFSAPLALFPAVGAGLLLLPWASATPSWYVPVAVVAGAVLAAAGALAASAAAPRFTWVGLAASAGAVYAAVPDTEAALAIGVLLAALAVVPPAPTRLGAAVAAAALAAAGVDGSVGRPATAVALVAMVGLVPLASRLATAAWPTQAVALAAHAGLVLLGARYAGLGSSAPTTVGRTLVVLVLTGLVGTGVGWLTWRDRRAAASSTRR
jgi:hypothetical protein